MPTNGHLLVGLVSNLLATFAIRERVVCIKPTEITSKVFACGVCIVGVVFLVGFPAFCLQLLEKRSVTKSVPLLIPIFVPELDRRFKGLVLFDNELRGKVCDLVSDIFPCFDAVAKLLTFQLFQFERIVLQTNVFTPAFLWYILSQ